MQSEQAVDEVLGMFKAHWDTTGNPVIYPFVSDSPPDTQVTWARLTIHHIDNEKLTLGNAEGKAIWRNTARLIAQLSFPLENKGLGIYPACEAVKAIYDGKRTLSGIRFTHVVIKELGVLEGWFKVNIMVTFNYEELK